MIEIPNAGATKNATLRMQTTEPPAGQGFVGACLAPSISYRPALPNACFWVKVAGTVTGVTPVSPHSYVIVTARADSRVPLGGDNIFQPYSASDATLDAAKPDSYEVLLTCYPRDATKTSCPDGCCSPSRLVSRSCCDLGAHMTSLDGIYASGFAAMPTFP